MVNRRNRWLQWVSALALLNAFTVAPVEPFKRVCYLRPDFFFPVDSAVKLDLCTHIIIGFASIDSSSRVTGDPDFLRFCKLVRKSIHQNGSHAKIMFSIGGGGAGGFALATSTTENRKRLVDSIIELVEYGPLDGVDIDWEFPSWGHNLSRRFERDNFSHLLKDIRQEFDRYTSNTGRQMVLSAAVAAQLTMINICYQPKEIAKYVDYVNLMSYDFFIHKWYWPFIGHNSALHSRVADIGIASTFNTVWAANYWRLLGLAKEKIMVGIPTYGKRFTLYSKYLNYPGAVAVSSNGDCTFSDLCDFLNLNETVQKVDVQAKVPYAFNGYEWISFENEESVQQKARWIRRNHYGGAMLFSLNADDFLFRCSFQEFPLHRAVQRELVTP